jgi:hypothetical protein
MTTKEIQRRIDFKIPTVFKNPILVKYKHRYTDNYFTGFLVSICAQPDEKIKQGYTCYGIVSFVGRVDTSINVEIITDKDKIKECKEYIV